MCAVNGYPTVNNDESAMTGPVKNQLSHAEELENIIDRLDEKVDREREATRGSQDEPPD
jgi:hypothetical protein